MSQILTTAQVVARLGFKHRSSVMRYVESGRLPHLQHLGATNTYLFDQDAVDKFAAEIGREVVTTGDAA